MSKTVLLSIKPKYCEFIANGKKTIEVRKTKPELELPFKCYIYCTKSNDGLIKGDISTTVDYVAKNSGKVIGEFVCDAYIIDRTFGHDELFNAAACLDIAEVASYMTNEKMYGWHISDLIIYDTPKELGEFKKINRECWYADFGLAKRDCPDCKNADCFVSQPPMSWCYVS